MDLFLLPCSLQGLFVRCPKGCSGALPTFPTSQPRSPLGIQSLRTGAEGRKSLLCWKGDHGSCCIMLLAQGWRVAATRTDGWMEMS